MRERELRMPTTQELISAFVNVGLEALSPLLGGVAKEALKEGAGILLKEEAVERSRNFVSRLIQRVGNEGKGIVASGEVAESQMQRLIGMATNMLQAKGLTLGEWHTLQLEPNLATTLVMRRGDELLVGIDDGDRQLVRRLIESYYSAMKEDRETLAASEGEFRALIIKQIDQLPKLLVAANEEQRRILMRAAGAALFEIPERQWRIDQMPPGALLRADNATPVPFHGREGDLANLLSWCESEFPLAARLYTGQGGMGKTRLLIETCRRLKAKGWSAGFLQQRGLLPEQALRAMADASLSLFLVIDYAETRSQEVVQLVRCLTNSKTTARVVLLARQAGDWWDDLRAASDGVGDFLSGPRSSRLRLPPLATSIEQRRSSFLEAVNHFQAILKEPTTAELGADFSAPLFDRVLILHMMALATVEGTKPDGERGILDFVLRRERRFWTSLAEARHLPPDLQLGIAIALGAITLRGGASKDEAELLIARLPIFKGQPATIVLAISSLLHDAYPGGDQWIEPLQPDILGEHLAAYVLAGK